jgi:hypothetical protein
MNEKYDSNAILYDALEEIAFAQNELEGLRNLYRRLKDSPDWQDHPNYVFMCKAISKLGEKLGEEIEQRINEWLDGVPLNGLK